MEFYSSPQFKYESGMNTKPSREFLEEDGDEFFAEMRRQIMIMTGDPNDDDFPETEIVKPSATMASLSSTTSSQGNMSLWQNEYTTNAQAVPVQYAKSTGTGVFIPQSTARYIRSYKPRFVGKVNDKKQQKLPRQRRTSTDHENKKLPAIMSQPEILLINWN